MAETNPRRIKSMSTGPRPVLITCAPSPHKMPPLERFAFATALTIAFKSAAARILGSESTNSPMVVARLPGRAKSDAATLLLRDFSGYVLMPERSNSSYGKIMRLSILSSEFRILNYRSLDNQHRVAVAVE